MKLPSLFSDHMVLQRGRPIPVWGWSRPGQTISVSLAGRTAVTVSGDDGRWFVRLPRMKAGGPFEMTIVGDRVVRFRDVMMGEVWVGSGQSNMRLALKEASDPRRTVAEADHPSIRVFRVGQVAASEPQRDVRGGWRVCSPRTAGGFSAVGYHFARALRQRLKVPVGLIVAAWGGTRVEAWMPREALAADRGFLDELGRYERGLRPFARDVAACERCAPDGEEPFYPRDPGNRGERLGWAGPVVFGRNWNTMNLPGYWQDAGQKHSGVFWFRKEVDVPAGWAGRDLILRLCPCDKQDTTYFNGERIGGMGSEDPNAWATPRVYRVPGRLVRAGRNVIAVRIYSYIYSGGMWGDAGQMGLAPAGRSGESAIPLAGAWRFRVERNFGLVRTVQNSPSALYRGMIAPLIPYAIRGVIWYQGEANVGQAREYRMRFARMIRGWRRAWGQGDVPFLFVQLPNYLPDKVEPAESQWADLREAQASALRLANTGMAVTIDIGDAGDIHPKNKQDVGNRLGALALHGVYRVRGVVPCGPTLRSARREGARIRLRFDRASEGLRARAGQLTGFDVAGADRKYVSANAEACKQTVVVWTPSVPRPVAVRYAWADNPTANLVNGVGLPAAPFRIDVR